MKLKQLLNRKTLGTWLAALLFIPSLSILASCTPNPLDYDMTGISFNDSSFTYDGAPHSILIEGTLPTGVTVEYTNNGKIDAGSYIVTASFVVTDEKYNPITPWTANLTIEKADIEGIALVGTQYVYDGEPKSLLIEGELPEGVTVSYTGNEQLEPGTYTVEASFTSTNTNYNDLPTLSAEMTIQKATYNMSGVSFNGNSSLYDGQVHYLEIEGELPEGVDVTYYNNDQTEAGEYEVTAYFSVDETRYNHVEAKTASLTILKASVSGISFNGNTVAYDGNPHSLAVEGELPSGVSVIYFNNEKTQPGTYTVTAHFVDDTGNYEALPDMTATLKIEKLAYDVSGISFNNASYSYDGTAHTLTIDGTLPEGVSVTYTENTRTEVGSTEVMASFSGDGVHSAIPDMVATLTITKAEISGISFSGDTYIYDGQAHSLSISGTLPSGIAVTYVNNGHTDVGTYTVTAHFLDSTGNYSALPDMTATLQINAAEYDASGISFNSASYVYDGAEHALVISGTLPEGVTVSYTSNKLTNVGVLEVVASFSGNENYHKISDMTATLTITKASISGISFDGMTVTYDGASKSLAISGTLPSGVSVRYINNEGTNVGIYTVTAKFTDLTGNYNSLPDMTATLQINKATYDMSGVSFNDTSYVYNGSEQSLTISGTLPVGVSVSYIDNTLTNVGSILATACFVSDLNHHPISDQTATLTITKASITGICLSGATIDYDGSAHSLYIDGTLPTGVNVTYTNNNQTAPGTYTVTAHFEDTTGNYSAPGDMTAVMQINPDYTISTAQELANISVDLAGSYVLENDIDLAGTEWTPIGNNLTPFTGALNGQGHTISNLTIKTPQVYVGLFGYNNGAIENLKLIDVNINVVGLINTDIFGSALSGYNSGNVVQSHVLSGNVFVKARGESRGYVGGLIGLNEGQGRVENCSNRSFVSGDLTDSNGGLVGYCGGGEINSSANFGSVNGTEFVGGLCGYSINLYINGFENSGVISGGRHVGGLIGYAMYTNINNAINKGIVNATSNCAGIVGTYRYYLFIRFAQNLGNITGSDYVGGLVSFAEFPSGLNVSDSFNNGAVTGTNYVGGLVASVNDTTAKVTITKSHNTGPITGTYGVGGLVGYGSHDITASYNQGQIRGTINVGGLVGYGVNTGFIENSFNEGSVFGTSSVGGLAGFAANNNTISNSFNAGTVTGTSEVAGFVGRSGATSCFFYNVLNVADIYAADSTVFLGAVLARVYYYPQLDFDVAFNAGMLTSGGLEVAGNGYENAKVDLNSINAIFFQSTLKWSTDVWDFAGLDVVNGIYPTLIV